MPVQREARRGLDQRPRIIKTMASRTTTTRSIRCQRGRERRRAVRSTPGGRRARSRPRPPGHPHQRGGGARAAKGRSGRSARNTSAIPPYQDVLVSAAHPASAAGAQEGDRSSAPPRGDQRERQRVHRRQLGQCLLVHQPSRVGPAAIRRDEAVRWDAHHLEMLPPRAAESRNPVPPGGVHLRQIRLPAISHQSARAAPHRAARSSAPPLTRALPSLRPPCLPPEANFRLPPPTGGRCAAARGARPFIPEAQREPARCSGSRARDRRRAVAFRAGRRERRPPTPLGDNPRQQLAETITRPAPPHHTPPEEREPASYPPPSIDLSLQTASTTQVGSVLALEALGRAERFHECLAGEGDGRCTVAVDVERTDLHVGVGSAAEPGAVFFFFFFLSISVTASARLRVQRTAPAPTCAAA